MDRDRFYDIAVSVASRMSGELKDGALATLSGTVINEVGSDDYHEVRFQVLDGRSRPCCTFGIWPSKDLAELGDGRRADGTSTRSNGRGAQTTSSTGWVKLLC